jgi:hypothetical protein
MARGSEAKEKRKEARKEARDKEKELLEEVQNEFELNLDADFPTPSTKVTDGNGGENITVTTVAGDGEAAPVTKKKKRKKKTAAAAQAQAPPQPVAKGIKRGPLIMLVMLTGTTLLPALLYAGDWFGSFIQKNHILGSLGHRLNVGSSPRKRVVSFYEKHDPDKLGDLDTILAKYYGDYPTLTKRLERKYGDYGYFMNWEQDEAPSKLAFEKLEETKKMLLKEFNKRAPQSIKTAVRNANQNVSVLYRKGKIVWRKQVWPILEPIFGVPDGAKEQKRKDRAESLKRKGKRKKNEEFRDDEF